MAPRKKAITPDNRPRTMIRTIMMQRPVQVNPIRKEELELQTVYEFYVYRTDETPDLGNPTNAQRVANPKPNPVEFEIMDENGKIIERDTAITLGSALDYASAWATKNSLVATPKDMFYAHAMAPTR